MEEYQERIVATDVRIREVGNKMEACMAYD